MDIDHLRKWIGREERACETISERLVQQFAATFDLEIDVAPREPTPLMIHWCLEQNAVQLAMLGRDGHPKRGTFLPPVSLPRRMWAGGAVTFEAPMRIGDLVERRSRIADVTMKEGRSGSLCFVTVAHAYSVDGQPVISERQDIVYRGERTAVGEGTAPEPAAQGAYSRRIVPWPPFLMRYSAVTFNAHRIHYDLAYAQEVEGYAGLIVHGPLQATLLCQYAAALHGSTPKRFSFRSLAPITDQADFVINAEEAEGGLRLWTAQVGGPVAMQAEATW
ncbi:3-methylfumaryl-CoA hydratase [Roseovarius azorensis]|uniref:3-methylfumaryl-CoA hydratase n=1 Tax=Roseovarius azorensis TaxID=1287727 RepID=A0A1H7XRY8_9RHOB|nr:MaoC family dehydratase N-terminal domain-containing protein [Roseovarius azorensis]SEM36435.1 3-methylfumaryl-CoA hydratase [Roseovarius azorensis]